VPASGAARFGRFAQRAAEDRSKTSIADINTGQNSEIPPTKHEFPQNITED
jgi:hypothetical protein